MNAHKQRGGAALALTRLVYGPLAGLVLVLVIGVPIVWPLAREHPIMGGIVAWCMVAPFVRRLADLVRLVSETARQPKRHGE